MLPRHLNKMQEITAVVAQDACAKYHAAFNNNSNNNNNSTTTTSTATSSS